MLTNDGESPAGFGIGIDKENYSLLTGAKATITPNFANKTTVQTYSRLFRWQPFNIWGHIYPTSVMFVIAEMDQVSPLHLQKSYFEKLLEPKSCLLLPDKSHMNVLSGDTFTIVMDAQIKFAKEACNCE